MFSVCYWLCTPSHSPTILLRQIVFCGTHLSFGFFGIGPVRFFCVRSCLFPLPLGVLERRRHLFFYLLPQMKQNTTVTSDVNAKVNWPYASATTFNTNKREGFLWSMRTDQKLRKYLTTTQYTSVLLSNYKLQGNLFRSCCSILLWATSRSLAST